MKSIESNTGTYEDYALNTIKMHQTELQEMIAKIDGGSLKAEHKKALKKRLVYDLIESI